MKFTDELKIVAILGALMLSPAAYPAAFQLYELGTPVIGTAAVGQAVLANDASTAYFNPAGMTALPSSEFMVGSEVIVTSIEFSKNTENTIKGDNGGQAGALIPGVGLYYVYSYSPKLKFGLSFTSPYAGLLNYRDGWAGRYLVQYSQLLTLNLNPSVAYKINNWAAVGVGIAVEYAYLYQSVALDVQKIDPSFVGDGQANVDLNNVNEGYNIGFLFTPGQRTKIGVAYRSQIVHTLTGSTTFLNDPRVPATSSKIVMPQNVIVSIDQKVANRWNLLAEAGWSNWSTMKKNVLILGEFSGSMPQDWIDTYRVGLGGQFKATPAFLLQAGASYDSSPTKAALRTPNLPMDRQIRGGVGLIYTPMQAIQIGLAYEYIDFGNAAIHNGSDADIFAGSYDKNFANVLQASINVAI